ncbi:MAG: hypothetical protein GY816_06045 [Cytophagales bacterium]|nr:hypothetical protein [Cytophagales bacterium]
MMQWFGPEGFVVGDIARDFVVGGAYRIELKKELATSFTVVGEYTEIDRLRALNSTYSYVGLSTPPPPSVVRISLLANCRRRNHSAQVDAGI